MRSPGKHRRKGQVLLMVTLALFLIGGMLGLVVDLGWAYFVKKSAQTAADAAALAAVQKAMDGAGDLTSYNCSGDTVWCTGDTPLECSTGSTLPRNLQSACVYASKLGYTTQGRQRVTVQASDAANSPTVVEGCGQEGAMVHHPPTTGCNDVNYWVTVRIEQRIPQLFSAILGNTEGGASARSTAGVARVKAMGSLILLNRQNDVWNPSGNPMPRGVNLYVGGGGGGGQGGGDPLRVDVPGGILLASTAHGLYGNDAYAGYISGGGTVQSPSTRIRAGGSYDISGGGSWVASPGNIGDGMWFQDPYSSVYGKGIGGQPPLTITTLPLKPVQGGVLDYRVCPNNVCTPGNYFAVGPQPGCSRDCLPAVATGQKLVVSSDLTFLNSEGDNAGFGEYYFYGGIQISHANVTFGPGRYVLAGVLDPSRTPLFDNENMAQLLSTGTNGSDAGRIFILTDTGYLNRNGTAALAPQLNAISSAYPLYWGDKGDSGSSLWFSNTSIKAGNNDESKVELNGLNAASGVLPDALKPFAHSPMFGEGAGVVIWQDQRNSFVKYTPQGQVDISCDGLDSPCRNSYPSDGGIAPQLQVWATPYASYNGIIYQPRGAWTIMQASGDYVGAIRIVSGALKTQGNGNLVLKGGAPPIISHLSALIE